jgi:adenylate kinase family enzyme
MKKVLVIGSPGSGKSTFARKLQDITGLPLVYLDRLQWNADRTVVDRSVFLARLEEALQMDAWIIDGNYACTLEMRLQVCDTVFFLDFPVDLCLKGIEERRGTVRPDMPWVEEEEDPAFTEFVRRFPVETRPVILDLLEQYDHKEIHTFTSREEANQYIQQLYYENSR